MESVVVGGEAAAWLAGLPVEPDGDSEREQSLADPGDDAGHSVSAVAFEGELAALTGFDRGLPGRCERNDLEAHKRRVGGIQ